MKWEFKWEISLFFEFWIEENDFFALDQSNCGKFNIENLIPIFLSDFVLI